MMDKDIDQKSSRHVIRWLKFSMSKVTLRYKAVAGVFTVCGFLMYIVLSRNIERQWNIHTRKQVIQDETKIHAGAVERNETDIWFHEDKYNHTNEVLQSKVIFNGSERYETMSMHTKGLSNPINRLKHVIASNGKFLQSYFETDHFFRVGRLVKDVNCHAIIKGDEKETKKAQHISATNPKVGVKAKQYIQMTSNCSSFISERAYIAYSMTEVENNFQIAFSLLVYKDVEQIERLLRAIYRPQNIYCIHVDKKSSDDIFKAMSSIANCFENVFIARIRYNVVWGTMTVLEPDLLCMDELWNKSKSWKYFINLTGQEFPLRTNYELVQILRAYNGVNDIHNVGGTIKRADKSRWKGAGTPPHGIVPTKGEVHIVASRGYVDYVLHNQKAQDFLKWTRRTKVPDETFYSSLNHNPSLGVPGSYKGYPETDSKDNIKPFVARFKNWGQCPCKGKRVREVCIFGTGDLPLLATRRELFANKYFLYYDHFALDCMEELHFNHTRDEYLGKLTFDPEWYSKLGFVSNKVD